MPPQTTETLKRRAAGLSLLTNTSLTALKLVAAAVTGSVSLFSEAAHSATDVVASALGYASVKAAALPPDEEHPYGHGKIESLAGFGESILLLAIVAYISIEAIRRFTEPHPIQQAPVGLAVMTLSAAASAGIGLYVSAVGRKTDSIVLRTNGQHLQVDFWTSLGVLLAIAVSYFTGWQQADPVFALLLAVWIARNAWQMSVEAFQQLIDRRISDEELEAIKDILKAEPRALSFHKLRTRHSGSSHYVEVHVVVPTDYSLVEAHDVADTLEKKIEATLDPCHVVIHVDPYDPGKRT